LIDKDLREKLRDKKFSIDKYYKWSKRYELFGLAGLLDWYHNPGCRIVPEIKSYIEKLIWENHLCRFQDIFEDLGIIFGKETPSYYSIRNFAKGYREKFWPELVFKHEGQKGLRDRNMEVALGRADEDLTQPNQRWEIDTTIADIFTGRKVKGVVLKTKDSKRCKIIGVIDDYSRLARLYLVERETALMVGYVIKDCMLAWGVPIVLVIDNGSPYRNRRILPFLRSIGISVHICLPGNPVEKPYIERFFRTLTEKFFRRLSGYSGNSVASKPNEIEIKYTMAELQGLMDEYISNIYSETVHRSTGQRPRERMSQTGFTPKTINERELDVLMMLEYERKVRQGHITYQGGKYFHPKLPETRTVVIRPNDFDASELLVFIDRKFLCTAVDYARKGKSPQEIMEAKKERNKELRTRIKAHEALLDKTDDAKDQRIHAIIEHGKKNKPIELPNKADILEFPEVKGIPYSRPGGAQNPAGSENEASEGHQERLIRNKQEMYLDVMERKQKGLPLDSFDQQFLEEFLISDEFKMVGSYLDRQLQVGESK
jgi:transposase InsO family protein